eukprot:2067688-Rhodomonas_salina.3
MADSNAHAGSIELLTDSPDNRRRTYSISEFITCEGYERVLEGLHATQTNRIWRTAMSSQTSGNPMPFTASRAMAEPSAVVCERRKQNQ